MNLEFLRVIHFPLVYVGWERVGGENEVEKGKKGMKNIVF